MSDSCCYHIPEEQVMDGFDGCQNNIRCKLCVGCSIFGVTGKSF